MSDAHIISSRSDYDPDSAFLVALQVVMWTTFGLAIVTLALVFVIT
jgi:hypothetical protein